MLFLFSFDVHFRYRNITIHCKIESTEYTRTNRDFVTPTANAFSVNCVSVFALISVTSIKVSAVVDYDESIIKYNYIDYRSFR